MSFITCTYLNDKNIRNDIKVNIIRERISSIATMNLNRFCSCESGVNLFAGRRAANALLVVKDGGRESLYHGSREKKLILTSHMIYISILENLL